MPAECDGPEITYQALIYPSVGIEEDQPSVREHTGIVLSESIWNGSVTVTTGARFTDAIHMPIR
jgi:hypothetical protein